MQEFSIIMSITKNYQRNEEGRKTSEEFGTLLGLEIKQMKARFLLFSKNIGNTKT